MWSKGLVNELYWVSFSGLGKIEAKGLWRSMEGLSSLGKVDVGSMEYKRC